MNKYMIARGILGRKLRLHKRGMTFIARGSGAALKKLTPDQFSRKFESKLSIGGGSGKKSFKPLTFKF